MPDTPEIRPLERGDEAEWRRLWTAYLEFYESSVPEEVYVSSFERMLAGNAGSLASLITAIAASNGGPG